MGVGGGGAEGWIRPRMAAEDSISSGKGGCREGERDSLSWAESTPEHSGKWLPETSLLTRCFRNPRGSSAGRPIRIIGIVEGLRAGWRRRRRARRDRRDSFIMKNTKGFHVAYRQFDDHIGVAERALAVSPLSPLASPSTSSSRTLAYFSCVLSSSNLTETRVDSRRPVKFSDFTLFLPPFRSSLSLFLSSSSTRSTVLPSGFEQD